MTSVISRMRPEENSSRTRISNGQQPDIALLPIGADLLPRQTASGRGGRSVRLLAAGVVLLAVVAVAGAYLFSAHQNSSADSALATAQDQQRSLQTQQRGFAGLVSTQQQSKQLGAAIATIMATDTSWSTVITDVVKADPGIDFTSIAATAAGPTDAAAVSTGPTTPGAIGTLTISGSASGKPVIATFVDSLSSVSGFADPFLSAVNQVENSTAYTFTVAVTLTDDLRTAVKNRWTTTTIGGGK